MALRRQDGSYNICFEITAKITKDIQRSLIGVSGKECLKENLGLASKPVDKWHVGKESILIFWVSELSEKLLDIFLGDLITKIGKNVLKLSKHHGSVVVFVVQLKKLNVVVVGSGGVGGALGSIDLFNNFIKLGELFALLISLSKTNAHLLCGVHAKGIHNITKEEKVKLAFAIPIVNVADFLNSLSVNHFETWRLFASLDFGKLKVGGANNLQVSKWLTLRLLRKSA